MYVLTNLFSFVQLRNSLLGPKGLVNFDKQYTMCFILDVVVNLDAVVNLEVVVTLYSITGTRVPV